MFILVMKNPNQNTLNELAGTWLRLLLTSGAKFEQFIFHSLLKATNATTV